jgi:transcriptional regulator with XRE-family HTH domain
MATLTPELQAVEKAHDVLGLTYREIADAINATESTLHRWRKGQGPDPTPVFLARLGALDAFLVELERTFRNWKDARAWLDQGIPFLQNRTPRDMILSGHVDRVTGVLYALNAGIPT